MHTVVRLIAAIALLGALGACSQLGISSPSGMSYSDPAIYETSLSE